MKWDPSLETGVAIIDQQHQELFRRVGNLLDACRNRKGKEKIAEIIGFLEQYVVEHFADEEQLHTESGYPKAAIHRIQHQQYVQKFQKLKQQYLQEGESVNIIISVNQNVVNWLTTHINGSDREFTVYYKKFLQTTKL